MAKGIKKKSIKTGSIKTRRKINKQDNIGRLINKYRDLDEVLYPFVTGIDMVYDDMDFTIEEFADIAGADVEEVISEIERVIH